MSESNTIEIETTVNTNKPLITTNTECGWNDLANKIKLNDAKTETNMNNINLSDIDELPIHKSDSEDIFENSKLNNDVRTENNKSPVYHNHSIHNQSPVYNNQSRNNYANYARNRFMKPGETPLSPEDEYVEKIKLLAKIEEMSDFDRKFDMKDDFYEIRYYYELKKSMRDRQNGIALGRGFMMNAVSALEFLNEKYDPFAFKLKGWSEHLNCNIDSYDDVFGELYEKYRTKGKIMPEIKLLLMLSSSAVQFHLSKTLFSGPGLDSILNKNPELLSKLMNNKDNQMREQEQELRNEYEKKIREQKNEYDKKIHLTQQLSDNYSNKIRNQENIIRQQESMLKQNQYSASHSDSLDDLNGPSGATDILQNIRLQQELKNKGYNLNSNSNSNSRILNDTTVSFKTTKKGKQGIVKINT